MQKGFKIGFHLQRPEISNGHTIEVVGLDFPKSSYLEMYESQKPPKSEVFSSI